MDGERVIALQREDANMANVADKNTGYDRKPVSQEQLQKEFDYVRAQRILEAMLGKGLISMPEFNKITALNRKTFYPALAEIMPSTS